ncbi:hypothetical protein DICPUDRAFT_38833 [Dictyostelium purpureum]|uniref:Uncharacterized protein n=1 Tax=Dictyostelium purpureum TaxID=5786 RepID=F0ZVA9_DICPU|nr:uncharacterized protein DICPUDRAFT_38833 [Dictyostelium purpureum]EGC32112.1 hypothetical protein DICPUDRAFT_38833 [Dictyostelium purpureum]|eukprot:XP_003291362.1 hypothetical protein DICPUDRAFT_38833 [Dictyostelium purpureum]
MNKERDNDLFGSQLNQILILLQTVQCQIKRISTFQDQTYQWNTKHHQYLQNVLKSFNKINAIFNTKEGNFNDSNNNQSNDNKIIKNQTFHQKIISVYDPLNPFSQELQYLVMQIDKDLFDELEEESIIIIYPFILKWFKEENPIQIVVALVLLWEISLKFHYLGKKFKDINKKLLVCLNIIESKGIINNLHCQGVFPFSEEEYIKLKSFLE